MIKDLDIILSKGESYTVEFKESADKSIASEACAFANASGGHIYVGITDKGKVIGTDTSNSARSRLQDTLNKIEPRLPVDISIHDNILVVTVPEGKVICDALVNDDYAIADNFKETEFQRFLEKAGISDVLPREEMLKNLNCAELASNGKLSYTNAGLMFFRDNSQYG